MVGALTCVKVRADTHHVGACIPKHFLIQLVDPGGHLGLVALRPRVERKVAIDCVCHVFDALIAKTGPVGDQVDVTRDLPTYVLPFANKLGALERRNEGFPVDLELGWLVLEGVDERRNAVDRPIASGRKVEREEERKVADPCGSIVGSTQSIQSVVVAGSNVQSKTDDGRRRGVCDVILPVLRLVEGQPHLRKDQRKAQKDMGCEAWLLVSNMGRTK